MVTAKVQITKEAPQSQTPWTFLTLIAQHMIQTSSRPRRQQIALSFHQALKFNLKSFWSAHSTRVLASAAFVSCSEENYQELKSYIFLLLQTSQFKYNC